jgi:hypothetical protein
MSQIDSTFTADTEARLIKIEETMTDIWQMLRNVMTPEQFNRLNVINQTESAKLSTRLDTCESDLADLEEKYNNLL